MTDAPRTIAARIRFLTAEEGGRRTPARDGIRPQIKVGDVFTSAVVASSGDTAEFDAGVSYEVTLAILFWDQYSQLFDPQDPVQLFEGSHLIAEGEIIDGL